MSDSSSDGTHDEGAVAFDRLPPTLHLLCVCTDEPRWAGLALQLDAAGCESPRFRWALSPAETATALREDHWDCVLVVASGADDTVGFARFVRDVSETVRTSGSEAALIVLAPSLDEATWSDLVNRDGEVYLGPSPWTSPMLMPALRRAVRRNRSEAELQRLSVDHRRRLAHDRDEAERLLRQQQAMIVELGAVTSTASEPGSGTTDPRDTMPIPPEVDSYYHDLLRTFVIMGSGGLNEEIGHIAELFAIAGLGPRDALQLHVDRVERLVRGLGNRSSRHVMSRANLLALELVVRLGECYQAVAGSESRPLRREAA